MSTRPLTVVTGGGRGIGSATSVHLARAGHDVVVGCRSDAASADTPVEVVRRVVDVDLVGALLCARRAAQVMSTGRGGAGRAIVDVSSAAATLGSAHEYVHYAAAKAGVGALTVGLAEELAGQGVRVDAVAPGLVATRIHADAGQGDRAERSAAPGGSRWDAPGSPRRSPLPSPGCSTPRRPTSPARCCAWPAGCEAVPLGRTAVGGDCGHEQARRVGGALRRHRHVQRAPGGHSGRR